MLVTVRLQSKSLIEQDSDTIPAIVFLSSKEARWITGLIMPVDGGVSFFPILASEEGRS